MPPWSCRSGQQVLESHLDQGFITRQVTNYLNLPAPCPAGAGLGCGRRRRSVASASPGPLADLGGMVATLGLLAWLHPQLDELIDR